MMAGFDNWPLGFITYVDASGIVEVRHLRRRAGSMTPAEFNAWAKRQNLPFLMKIWGTPPPLNDDASRVLDLVTDTLEEGAFVTLPRVVSGDELKHSPWGFSKSAYAKAGFEANTRAAIWLTPALPAAYHTGWFLQFMRWSKRKARPTSRICDSESRVS